MTDPGKVLPFSVIREGKCKHRDSVRGMRRFEDETQGSDREKDDPDSERGCVCARVRVCARLHVCACACVHVCVHVCVYA